MDLNTLGRGQFGNAVARLYNLDDLNAVNTLAPEVLPTVDIWQRPEFWALLGGNLGGAWSQLIAAGGAGQAGGMIVNNLAGSGLLGIIERFYIANAVTVNWGLRGTVDLTDRDSFHRDGRRALTGVAAGVGLRAEAGNSATDTLLGSFRQGAMLGPNVVEGPWILDPGRAFGIQGQDNAIFNVTVMWRERPLGPNEGVG